MLVSILNGCVFQKRSPATLNEGCSITFFVSLQEEETPLSAGLLSLHVHGTVSLHGIIKRHCDSFVKN